MRQPAENDVCDGCQKRPCVCETVVLPTAEKDVICPCGHSITRHSPEWGCDAYVPPKIGGSGACCTRSPAAVVASVIPPAEKGQADA